MSMCASLAGLLSLSLGSLANPHPAAGSSVRVFVWVIRSPETLRVCVPHPSSRFGPGHDTGTGPVFALRCGFSV